LFTLYPLPLKCYDDPNITDRVKNFIMIAIRLRFPGIFTQLEPLVFLKESEMFAADPSVLDTLMLIKRTFSDEAVFIVTAMFEKYHGE
jgi:hypothetical protein